MDTGANKMKKCTQCETITNDNYTNCPSCKGKFKAYKPKPQRREAETVEDVEPISALCVDGDIGIGEV